MYYANFYPAMRVFSQSFPAMRVLSQTFPAMRDNSFEQTYLPGLAHVQSLNSEINPNILLTHMFNHVYDFYNSHK